MNTMFLEIDSRYRTGGSVCEATYKLPKLIEKMRSCALINFQCFNVFFNVNEYNNTICINNEILTIPVGDYDTYTLCQALQAISPIFTLPVINQITKKLSIASQPTYFFEIDFSRSTCNTLLGFPSVGTTGTQQTTYTSPNIIQLGGCEYIQVKCPDLVPYLHSLGMTHVNSNLLGTIYISVPFGSSIILDPANTHTIIHHHPRILETFSISLTDFIGSPLNLQGTNYKCCIKITYE
jgi:hypothetical protein